ncbi:hypothetical protein ABHC11_05960, partial [Escherichia coli]
GMLMDAIEARLQQQ